MSTRNATLPLHELDVVRLRRLCAAHTEPGTVHCEAEIARRAVTIVQRYRPWPGSRPNDWIRIPVAQCRWSPARSSWLLYYWSADDRWAHYGTDSTAHLDVLVMEIDVDPSGCFWG